MLRNFLYFIKRDPETSSIEELAVPELCLSLKGERLFGLDESKGERSIENFLHEKVLVRIHELQKDAKEIPDITKAFEEIPETDLARFLCVDENVSVKRIKAFIPERKKGYCEKYLPVIGTVACVSAAIAGGVTSYVASYLTFEDSLSPSENRNLSITLDFCSQLVGLAFYFGAKSNDSLRMIGRSLDKYLAHVPIPQAEQKETGELKYTGCARTKIIALNGTIATLYLINFLNNTISTYQGLDALGTQAQTNSSFIQPSFYNFAKIAQIIMGSISGVSFGAPFMIKISNQLKERFVTKEFEEKMTDGHGRINKGKSTLARLYKFFRGQSAAEKPEDKTSDTYTEEDANRDRIENADSESKHVEVIIEMTQQPQSTPAASSSQTDSIGKSLHAEVHDADSTDEENPYPWQIKILRGEDLSPEEDHGIKKLRN